MMSSTIAVHFSRFGAIDEVGLLDAHHVAVGRNGDDVEVVDLGEFRRFGTAVPVMPASFLYLRK